MTFRARASLCVWVAIASGCGGRPAPPLEPPLAASAAPSASASAPPVAEKPKLSRQAFNQSAVRANLPLFWASDGDGDGEPDPSEVLTLAFYPTAPTWVSGDRFTPEYDLARATLEAEAAAAAGKAPGISPQEARRRELVVLELDQGMPTLVRSDLRKLSEAEKRFVDHVLAATALIDELYATQKGARALRERVPADHLPSQSLFRRNWGPRCEAPRTEKEPECSAIPGAPKPMVAAYPEKLQAAGDRGFCKQLEARKDAKQLLAPFVVVREKGAGFEAVPYVKAFPELMPKVTAELAAAEQALAGVPGEDALSAYLRAAAKSFESNDWEPADEAWSKMNARNSKWYLRIAPDETYWDPCNHKAGFHATFARINSDSLAWQDKLEPVRQEMEAELAKLIGAPYKARKVSFHLPDFIDIVSNGGDDRPAFGATIGQSLPNWGKVANEGRGRTVAMSNLYTDADSRKNRRAQAASLLGARTFALLVDDTVPGLLGTILHEATHNLGPSHEYKYQGRTDAQAFGGPLSQMLEELKAQSGALYYLDLLARRGVIGKELREQAYVDSIVWGLGHVSRGMYSEDGQPKTYSQLAAIQLGYLMEQKVLTFDSGAHAANGTDNGAFALDLALMPAASEKLMKLVGQIKAKNDRAAGEQLIRQYVDAGPLPRQIIEERFLRFPKNSFVYVVER